MDWTRADSKLVCGVMWYAHKQSLADEAGEPSHIQPESKNNKNKNEKSTKSGDEGWGGSTQWPARHAIPISAPPQPRPSPLNVHKSHVIDTLDHQWRQQVLPHETESLCTGGNPVSTGQGEQLRTEQITSALAGLVDRHPFISMAVSQDGTLSTQHERRD